MNLIKERITFLCPELGPNVLRSRLRLKKMLYKIREQLTSIPWRSDIPKKWNVNRYYRRIDPSDGLFSRNSVSNYGEGMR